MKTVFFRLLDADDKATALQAAIRNPEPARQNRRFDVDPTSFMALPRAPFAYWVSERLRLRFTELPQFERDGRTAKVGLQTSDDFRLVRQWWEVPSPLIATRWFPFVKGGTASAFYADVSLVIRYDRGGQVAIMSVGRYGRGATHYFETGITWPARPQRRGAFAHVPAGCVFSHMGTMIFCSRGEHWALCAILNSTAYIGLLHMLMSRGGRDSGQTLVYEVGYVVSVPVPSITSSTAASLLPLLVARGH